MIDTMPHSLITHRITLLFNGNKIYDREVIGGIGAYLGSTRAIWDIFLEDDYRCRLPGIPHWQGDGVIADYDDPDVDEALRRSSRPVVAVGSSYENDADYPNRNPYVATDNFAIIKLAFDHLIEAGLPRIALYSMPESPGNRWAQEREKTYRRLAARDRLPVEIYRGRSTSALGWNESLGELVDWIKAQPKPLGVIAVNDPRARHVLQACLLSGIAVPEEVALVGVDNDPLTHELTRIPITSVMQGTHTIGWTAAQLLHQMLHHKQLPQTRILVPPVGISVKTSSQFKHLADPKVMRARHFIRQYAAQGIKAEQVADYVGVSRSLLESSFRKELECTVHEEILRFRLETAKSLLVKNQLSNTEIAVMSGFTSTQYMYTVFRREMGCTPREFRDRSQQESGGDGMI